MPKPKASACYAFLLLLSGATAQPAHGQVTGLRGMRDHSLCCAIGMANLHGFDGSFEPAPDPVLSRRRAPAPPAPAAVSANSEELIKPGVNIPGVDTFAREGVAPETNASPAVAETSDSVLTEPTYPPLVPPTRKIEGHLDVGFETLGGFGFKLTKAGAAAIGAGDPGALAAVNAQIPDLIRQLDGKKVVVTGYMLPMKMEGALATEFLLVANSMLCCYGVVPPMNQWATVKMARRGVTSQQDIPTQVFGTLRVQTRIENGALSAIYHLDADRVQVLK